jgi:hypothetical protein
MHVIAQTRKCKSRQRKNFPRPDVREEESLGSRCWSSCFHKASELQLRPTPSKNLLIIPFYSAIKNNEILSFAGK